MVMPSPVDLDPRVDPLVGQTLEGKYTLDKLIGRGGMGHVYAATVIDAPASGRREVVVKMIAPPLAQQPQAMARFEREAKRLDGLRHSNIVEMYDYGREGGRAYIVMEWVDGELLSDYLARKGPLSLPDFVPIAAQILKGVGHAHSRDLMIRDIKPANVMLCERKGRANFVKIIDFGLAKMLEGDEDITKQHFIGTSGYLSPEQIKGLDIDLRVDVYALGVLFYQMLSGRMPFEAENDTTLLYKHVHDFPTPLSEVLPSSDSEVPDELVHLIHDCLEKDPNDRPSDANEIVERLIDCVPMSMFKLPPASPAAAEQTAISALSTTALAAPTGETATFLRSDELEPGESTSSAANSAANEPVAAVVHDQPASGNGKLAVIAVGLGVVLAAVVGGVLVFGGGNKDQPDRQQQQAAVAKQDPPSEVQPQSAQQPQPDQADQADQPDQADAKPSASEAAEPDPQPAEPEPEPTLGTVEITSTPAGELSIDGSPVGNTPYDKPLPVGQHTIEIVAEGHAKWTKEIEIKAGNNPAIDVKLTALASADEHKPAAGKKPTTSKPSSPEQPQPQPQTQPEQPSKPAPDSPFLPTKKNKDPGPFLPTEK